MKYHLGSLFRGKAKITYKSLRQWNLVLALLHAAQGVVVLLISSPHNLPITASLVTTDSLQTQLTGKTELASATHQLWQVNVTYLLAAFFLMSALMHFLAATVWRSRYEASLKKSLNPLRWIEYCFSVSAMLVVMGLLVGMYDLGSLVLIFTLTVVLCLSMYVAEVYRAQIKVRQQFISSHAWVWGISSIVPWLVILLYLISTALFGNARVPTFVYVLYASVFFLFVVSGFNTYLQFAKKGKWANYLYAERWYMVLSLIAKSLLAWQVFAGVLRP